MFGSHITNLSKQAWMRSTVAWSISIAFAASSVGSAVPSTAQGFAEAGTPAWTGTVQGGSLKRPEPQLMYVLDLPNGDRATVYSGGFAKVVSLAKRTVEFRRIPRVLGTPGGVPDKTTAMAELMKEPTQPFADHRVIVVFRDGAAPTRDLITADASQLAAMRWPLASQPALTAAPEYTYDAAVNRAFASIGVDRSERLFSSIDRGTLSSMYARAGGASQQMLNPANAFALHIVNSSVGDAVTQLSKVPSILYASPDWTVTTMQSASEKIPQALIDRARSSALSANRAMQSSQSTVPMNYALSSSAQSMLNAPGNSVAAAYDEIQRRFHQIPGQGEIVTNVSLGDIDDRHTAELPPTANCEGSASLGPTTVLIGGQHYIDWPSMPLIPAYTADAAGNLSGSRVTCAQDPTLEEVGLDFSVMAPLPHNMQRPGEQGIGFSDLLGIAPGAKYRLIVPASFYPTISDIQAALLGAAMQSPRPNVISASLGYGADQFGFPSRYLEDDRLTESIVSSIVHSYGIVVSIAANDGLRQFTNAAYGPSGGSAETDVVHAGVGPTLLGNVYYSSAPSVDLDSGSIDAGGTTLDDINAAPPLDPANAAIASVHAFPETRWTGFETFSSGYGTRVNVSAPADNIVAFSHALFAAPACPPLCDSTSVNVGLIGGTSASAPEIAAAAAVVMQVARLTGRPFSNATEVRSFLASTATPVAAASQSDPGVNVGPQLNLTNAVETLLAKSGGLVTPGVIRTAVEQRQDAGDPSNSAGVFTTNTDPAAIDLLGPYFGPYASGGFRNDWITIAPDWEGMTSRTTYRLFVANRPRSTIATTRWARLLPKQLYRAAGIAFPSASRQTIKLEYVATSGGKSVADDITLTFSAAPASSRFTFAPIVPAVVSGPTIPVKYDFRDAASCIGLSACIFTRGEIAISYPARANNPTLTTNPFNIAVRIPLPDTFGTVNIPVKSLPGGGIYAVQLLLYHPGEAEAGNVLGSGCGYTAYTRVAPSGSSRPNAPLLARDGSAAKNFIEVPYNAAFQVAYDVSGVPDATGAEIEISAPGPGWFLNYSSFNNPNGSQPDHDGLDTGSVYVRSVAGTRGVVTIDPAVAGMTPTMYQNVRVLPLKGNRAAGEASDVSTVHMDGIVPSSGGGLGGFGISAQGPAGFLTSQFVLADGQPAGSIETFDQSSGKVTHVIPARKGTEPFTLGWGIWGGDVGLFSESESPASPIAFTLMHPVGSGVRGPAWTPPAAINLAGVSGGPAENQLNDDAMFTGQSSSGSGIYNFSMFTSNLLTGANSAPFDISKPIRGMSQPILSGFSENPNTKMGVAVFFDYNGDPATTSPVLVLADPATGSLQSIGGVGNAAVWALAVDSGTNKAAVVTDYNTASRRENQLVIYDLAAKTARVAATIPSYFGGYTIQADSAHHLFLVESFGALDESSNNNAMATVFVYDENGTLVKTIEKFSLIDAKLQFVANNLQVDPRTRSGYALGPGMTQIQPFSY